MKSMIINALIGIAVILLPVFLYSQERVIDQRGIAVNTREFYDNYMHLLEDEETFVIDGRTKEMFSEGHLKNAVNIDADDPDLLMLLHLHLHKPRIVVYCTTMRRTTDIVNVLAQVYHGEIVYISDGFRGWLLNGFPVWGFSALLPENSEEEGSQNNED